MAKLLIISGAILMIIGIAIHFGLPLGKLPGDINYRGKNFVFQFPIVTCIVASVILSGIMWFFRSR